MRKGVRTRVGVRFVAAVATLLACAITFALGTEPAGATSNGAWSIYPTNTAQSTIRAYFQPILTPGVPYHDDVTVANFSSSTETFNLYAADAINAPRGGAFSLKPEYKQQTAMGAWINLPESKVTLTAKSYEVIPFTINVPVGTTPGDHVGGIVLEPVSGVTSGNGNLHLTVLNAVGVRVYGRVQGKAASGLDVTQVSIDPHTSLAGLFGGAETSTVTFTVTNTGGTIITPTARVSVSPLVGSSSGTLVVHLPQLLPQSSSTFTEQIRGIVPMGDLTATVQASAGSESASGDGSAVVIPWLLILLIVLIVLGAALWLRWRASRAPGETEPAPTAGGPAPVPSMAGGPTEGSRGNGP